jgi:hypothetical protein
MRTMRKVGAGFLTLAIVFGPAACGSDEDGDGSTTDEEVDQLDEKGEDIGDDMQEEVDRGKEEVNN